MPILLPAQEGYGVDNFRIWLLNRELRIRTVKRHLFYLSHVLKECPNFTESEVLTYFAHLREKGLKNTYINHIIPTVRLYAQYKGIDDQFPNIKYRKEEPYEKAVMSQEEVEAFLALPRAKTTTPLQHLRWTVFFSICFTSGLRPGETAHLTVEDVDFGLGVFHIRQGKTPGSVGDVPISPSIINLLKHYISLIDTIYLFPSVRGGKGGDGVVYAVNWNQVFHSRLKRIGIKRKNLSVYSARHTFGSMLAWEDVNLYTIKELMRHTDIKTTERYMHRNLKSMKEAQKKIPLIRKGTEPQAILKSVCDTLKRFGIQDDERFEYTLEESGSSLCFRVKIRK